tara:strand:+ start:6736 stop:7725 length:990 start_codon:yes stop_codon:yes gene_type:complete
MAVTFQKVYETSADGDMPCAVAATSNVVTTGINAPGGPVEFFIIKGAVTFSAAPVDGDLTALVQSIRIVLNGEVVHDYRAGFQTALPAQATPSSYGVLLNAIGGRAYQDPNVAAAGEQNFMWAIPLGRQTAAGVNRYEVIITWGAGAAGVTGTGNLSYWLRMNPAMQQTTTVCPSTSFTHSASIEQVVVRVPQNVPGVVSAILVQNTDAFADNFGTQGIRVNALGPFGMDVEMWRWMNNDLANGIMWGDTAAADPSQTYAVALPGTLLLPVFGLKGGDIVLQVDSTAANSRTYTPIITNPVGAKEAKQVRQTQMAPGNTAQSIVKRAEN